MAIPPDIKLWKRVPRFSSDAVMETIALIKGQQEFYRQCHLYAEARACSTAVKVLNEMLIKKYFEK